MTSISLARLLDNTDSGVFVLSPEVPASRVSDLRLPDYFGANWDALADCLMDLEAVSRGPGVVMTVTGLETLAQQSPEDYDMLMGVLRDAATVWKEEGMLFCVLLAGRADVLGKDLTAVA